MSRPAPMYRRIGRSFDPAVNEAVDAYRTCEFVTLARDGTPMVWPTVALRRDDGTFLVTTSLAFAQKALNVRRDGREAMLFADPTGDGQDVRDQVFVSGRATCPEEIVSSAAGDEAYWSLLSTAGPTAAATGPAQIRSPAPRRSPADTCRHWSRCEFCRTPAAPAWTASSATRTRIPVRRTSDPSLSSPP
ncbi:pyridoxamine 5'-phosphate oxidase family protein [Streptomyces sp. NPDC046977]|uniref:pyridoxamine 5'-phosphate oxidase family protein n=1 Tax=Streptomyces sp. NPDC046977 TaxID=3154703 RepID=UPI0033EA5C0C